MARTGDTPHTDRKAALVDPRDEDVAVDGDTPRTEREPAVVDAAPAARPTAGEMRAAGYAVDPDVEADQVPSRYVADSPTPPGEVRLVEDTAAADDGLTPMERLREITDGDTPRTDPGRKKKAEA